MHCYVFYGGTFFGALSSLFCLSPGSEASPASMEWSRSIHGKFHRVTGCNKNGENDSFNREGGDKAEKFTQNNLSL